MPDSQRRLVLREPSMTSLHEQTMFVLTDPSSSRNFPTSCPSRSLGSAHSTSSAPCSSISTSSSFPSFASCGGRGADEFGEPAEMVMGISIGEGTRRAATRLGDSEARVWCCDATGDKHSGYIDEYAK